MKKFKIHFVVALLLGMCGLAFVQYEADNAEATIIYQSEGCSNANVSLFEFTGFSMEKIGDFQSSANGQFEYKMPIGKNGFYYIGNAMNNTFPVILGTEARVVLKGDCRQFKNTQVVVSPLNESYASIKTRLREMQSTNSGLIREYRSSRNNPEQLEQTVQKFIDLDAQKLQYYETIKKENAYLGKVVAFNTYFSYQSSGKGYKSEFDYYISEFFSLIDWKDEDLNRMPWVFEKAQEYASTISLFKLPNENHKMILDMVLQDIPSDSRAYQLALAGITAGLKSRDHTNFVPFAKQYVEKYEEAYPNAVKPLKIQLEQSKAFVIGGEAPDFSQVSPEGASISLSDLKGKIVLVDFWASWCGPCRRENPNVVRMYNKYKDKGFEILGVSLDSNKDRWVAAIAKDGLTWPQISDLKGWANAAAQLYGVTSIPQTVLVDKDGKILARNLRGASLEAKLSEIFGNG